MVSHSRANACCERIRPAAGRRVSDLVALESCATVPAAAHRVVGEATITTCFSSKRSVSFTRVYQVLPGSMVTRSYSSTVQLYTTLCALTVGSRRLPWPPGRPPPPPIRYYEHSPLCRAQPCGEAWCFCLFVCPSASRRGLPTVRTCGTHSSRECDGYVCTLSGGGVFPPGSCARRACLLLYAHANNQ